MNLRKSLAAIFLLLLTSVLFGCSLLQEGDSEFQNPTDQAPPNFATVTHTPTPVPTTTPTPEPTPIPRIVRATDQNIDEDGTLQVAEVSLPADGWLVIYREVDGQPEKVIGQKPLSAGVHEAVTVDIDPEQATSTLYAGLNIDAGVQGIFEYPGADEPWPGEPRTRINVEIQLPRPLIAVTDQAISEDGIVTLDEVNALEPTWVLIHVDEGGEIGPAVGKILLEPGNHENATVSIPWREATPVLYAVLYEDQGEPGRFDSESDQPILINGQPVMASFQTTYPPNIVAYDQPVIDGGIVVDRVISNGSGWIAVYYDDGGQPGLIIGSAPLEDGLNTNIRVQLIESAVTPQLFLRLHQDSEPGDPFGFPAEDPEVLYNNRLPPPTTIRTDGGAHVIVEEQMIGPDDPVTVKLAVAPTDAWVAVQVDEDGQPGRMIGRTLIPAGVNRDVQIPLDAGWQPGLYHIVFYRDLGTAGRYDALGVDPLFTNPGGGVVRVPFTIQAQPNQP